MDTPNSPAPYELVDFDSIPGVPCPCGTARRAFAQTTDFPGTVHVTEISENARLHYHRTLTETYYFLECQEDAQMQLNEQRIPVRPGMCIMIRPGTRHRAIGRMRVLIVVFPKFDPHDEWFDDPESLADLKPLAVAGPGPPVRAEPMLVAQSEPS